MAICSYQTLDRVGDCSRRSHARDLDDIRSIFRESLKRARFLSKCREMMRNRPTLFEYLEYGVDEDFPSDLDEQADQHEDYPASQSRFPTPASDYGHDEVDALDLQSGYSSQGDPYWNTNNTLTSWSTPTCSVRSSPVHQTHIEDHQIPSFLLDTPSSTPGVSGRNSPNNRNGKNILNHTSVKAIRKSPRHHKPPVTCPELIRAKLTKLSEELGYCGSDRTRLSETLRNQWQTITLSLQSGEIRMAEDSLNALNALAAEYLILPQTIIFMLQHGLIFNLRDVTYKLPNGFSLICKLLVNLMRSCPSAIPYLVETMSCSALLDEFNDAIECGTSDESQYILGFYSQLSQMIMSLILSSTRQQFQPMIPEVLLATGVESHTLESYSPEATLKKLLKPKLIHNTVGKCLERSQLRDEHLVSHSLLLLADALKMAFMCQSSDPSWVISILCAFRDSRIESQLSSMIKGLNRLIKSSESSEHSSQGHMIEVVAARILDQSSQFMTFYQDCYNKLFSLFSQQICERPVDPTAIKNTDGFLDL